VIGRLQQLKSTQEHSQAQTLALKPLEAPPEIAATAPLAKLIQAITRATQEQRRARATLARLESLGGPPALHDLAGLEQAKDVLHRCQRDLQRRQRQRGALADLAPPQLTDAAGSARAMEACIAQLDAATARTVACEAEHRSRHQELQEAAQRINDWAAQGQMCPACGSMIDPQRLIERITTAGATR
jgi:hypothetical protein